jgi:hypothetical protein
VRTPLTSLTRIGACDESSAIVPRPSPLSRNSASRSSIDPWSIAPEVDVGKVTSIQLRPFSLLTSMPDPFVGSRTCAVGPFSATAKLPVTLALPRLSCQPAPVEELNADRLIVSESGAQLFVASLAR